jgi:DNA polymerase III alpha subunit
MRVGKRVRIAGMRETLRKITRSSGEVLYRMILEDLDGNLPVIIAKTVYHHHRNLLQSRGPFVVEGVVEVNATREQPYLRLEKIWPAR